MTKHHYVAHVDWFAFTEGAVSSVTAIAQIRGLVDEGFITSARVNEMRHTVQYDGTAADLARAASEAIKTVDERGRDCCAELNRSAA